MIITSNASVTNEPGSRAFQTIAQAKDRLDAARAYFFKRLSAEDVAFINYRGLKGEVSVPSWCADSFLDHLYLDPTDGVSYATHPVYYSAEAMQRHRSTMESMKLLLRQPYLDEKAKANLKQSIDDLQIVEQTLKPSCREQMTRLLETAKATFVHRGIAEEPQVAEAIGTIDAVLRNIKSFEEPGKSEQSAEFYGIYNQAVKQPCEYAVANGGNPFPLEERFYEEVYKSADTTLESCDAAWQKAMESVLPQTRYMAENLKYLLRLYAEISPGFETQDQGSGREWEEIPQPRTRANSWDLV